jgi:arylsulfatase
MGLQADGSYEDTIILFLADHGELLFDHNTYRKVFPYQGSSKIPLIVRVGRNIAPTKRAQSETLASLEDILPTLVDMAGGTIPADVDGHSLRNEIYQEDPQNRPYNNHAYVHGEHAFGYGLSNQFIVTAKDKYIWYSEKNEEQYFDLTRDPNELHDLISADDPEIEARVAYLRQLLIDELEGRPEGFVKDGKLCTVQQPPNYILPKE